MSKSPFMQLYVSDYIGDTQHLTTEQHGAYLLLLMAMWRNGGKLPNDPAKLSRIARVSLRRWHIVSPEVMEFMTVEGEFVTQKRLEREHQKALSISEKRSVSGKLGGSAKSLTSNVSDEANAKQLPKHSQKPETIKNNIGADAPQKSPREILSGVLSPAKAKAVVDHRQRIRKPLTADAAELLAKTFARTGEVGWTPDQAADEMISRGWQGVKLDWLQNSTPPKLEPATIGQSDDDWLRRLRFARMKSAWSANEWGPMPGQVGCKVPKHLLEPNDGKGWADQRPEPKRSVA